MLASASMKFVVLNRCLILSSSTGFPYGSVCAAYDHDGDNINSGTNAARKKSLMVVVVVIGIYGISPVFKCE